MTARSTPLRISRPMYGENGPSDIGGGAPFEGSGSPSLRGAGFRTGAKRVQYRCEMPDVQRFREAQERVYPTVIEEIRAGVKRSHWMWFIFPQVAGLGRSPTA